MRQNHLSILEFIKNSPITYNLQLASEQPQNKPVEHRNERSGIISFTMGSEAANKECYEKLREHNVVVAPRGAHIRVSPNFYNTEQEIERFLKLL